MSLTHRVLTATLCNKSKRKRISVPSLDQRPLKLFKSSSAQPTRPSKPLLYRLGSPLTSAGDRRLRRQRRSQNSHCRAGQACLAAHHASSMELHLSTLASSAVAAKTQTMYLQALRLLLCWLVRPTIRHDWTRQRTWPARRLEVCGGRCQTSHDLCHELSLGHRLPPGLEAPGAGIPSTSAKGTGAGGSMACGTQPKLLGLSTFECYSALRGFQLLPPIKGIPGAARKWSPLIRASWGSLAKQASATPACHWTRHDNFCFLHCMCSKQPEACGSSKTRSSSSVVCDCE